MSLSPIAHQTLPSAGPAPRTGAAGPGPGGREARVPQDAGAAPSAGPRPLRTALADTLAVAADGGADATQGAVREALDRFTGDLLDALRADGGREVGHGPGRHLQRGLAWGHYRGAALGERIESLAARIGNHPAPTAAEPAAAPVDATADGAEPLGPEPASADAAPVAVEGPAAPPAASSPLETSFAALWAALHPAADAATGADLAGFLAALAERLGAGGAAPTGGLVDTAA